VNFNCHLNNIIIIVIYTAVAAGRMHVRHYFLRLKQR